MANKVLGLDIGSHSIKAALFDTTFRSFVLTDLFQSPPLRLEDMVPEDHEVAITEAILQMIQKNHIEVDNTVTALSGKFVSNRMLKLPLPPKQLEKVLPFEIENYIPFPLDQLVIDHHIIESSKSETLCIAAAVQKNILENHLTLLQKQGIDPSFVTFDTLALYNLNQFVTNQDYKTYAIIDIGYQKTSLCIVSNQKAVFIRTLYTGGRDLDEAIRSELNLTLDQASEVKEKHGILEVRNQELKSADLKKLSACIKNVLDPLFQEIFQSLHLYRSQEWTAPEQQKIDQIFFCGGTSLLRNLPEYFTQLVNIPSQRLYLLDNDDPERPSRLKEPIFATAVGIGLKVSSRGKNSAFIESINFRKGDFSFSKSLGDFKDKMVFVGKWVAVIFLLAFMQLILRNYTLRHENNGVEKVALSEYKKIMPEEKVQTSKNAVKKLEAKIQELSGKQDVLTSGLTKTTALGVLRQLSILIPSDITIDAKELSIEKKQITLKGSTDSIASVDRVIASLQTDKQFKRVEKGTISDTPDGKRSFLISIELGEDESANKDKK